MLLCAKRRHRILIGSVTLPLLLLLVGDNRLRLIIDPLLRALNFPNGADDTLTCYNGDPSMFREWFELSRSLDAQTRLERRLLRHTRRSWESELVHDKYRFFRFELTCVKL